jgi:predicted nucleic acid-binding protein
MCAKAWPAICHHHHPVVDGLYLALAERVLR